MKSSKIFLAFVLVFLGFPGILQAQEGEYGLELERAEAYEAPPAAPPPSRPSITTDSGRYSPLVNISAERFYDVDLFPNFHRRLRGYKLVKVIGTPHPLFPQGADPHMMRANPARWNHETRVRTNLARRGRKAYAKMDDLIAKGLRIEQLEDYYYSSQGYESVRGDWKFKPGFIRPGQLIAYWPKVEWTMVWEMQYRGKVKTVYVDYHPSSNYAPCCNPDRGWFPLIRTEWTIIHTERIEVPYPEVRWEKIVKWRTKYKTIVVPGQAPLPVTGQWAESVALNPGDTYYVPLGSFTYFQGLTARGGDGGKGGDGGDGGDGGPGGPGGKCECVICKPPPPTKPGHPPVLPPPTSGKPPIGTPPNNPENDFIPVAPEGPYKGPAIGEPGHGQEKPVVPIPTIGKIYLPTERNSHYVVLLVLREGDNFFAVFTRL